MITFNTPAYQADQDFKDLPEALKLQFVEIWNNYVNFCTLNAEMGNPWTVDYDHPRSWYFNPTSNPVTPSADNTIPIRWTAFPNRINYYFQSLFTQKFPNDTDDKLHELADIGPVAFSAKYKIDLEINSSPCNPATGSQVPFGPSGPRGWQDEYCEWSVTRNAEGNIIAVDFTHENPEYWFHLWRVSPELVLKLYREILGNDAIVLDDLCLYDVYGKQVIVRETGRPAYNPINKWNSGTESTATSGGAIHLTSPPNSLGAEIFLGAAATNLREEDGKIISNLEDLICAAKYGQCFRNSDPRIGQTVNTFVNRTGLQVSLTNPIALYGQVPDFTLFELPEEANVSSIKDCYSIVRGLEATTKGYYPNNMILHSRFSVPEGANFTLSDIIVNHKPLKWGSQIADTFKVQLAGSAIAGPEGEKPPVFGPVVNKSVPLPNVGYVLDFDLLAASLANRLDQYSNLSSAITQVEAGRASFRIAAYTYDTDKTVQFDFGDAGIKVTPIFLIKIRGGSMFMLEIEVADTVPLGAKPLSLYHAATEERYPLYGTLEVVAPGTLADTDTPKTNELTAEDKEILKKLQS